MKIISAIKLVTCVACAICFVACREWHENPELKSIDSLASTSPDSALSKLKCFDKDTLNEADRHLYDLLSVKAADKAYITHTSDSVITEVIKYYSRHKDYGRYGEALYYGGRVNSDIGDYPTALRYFQEALDQLSVDDRNDILRETILSQMGRLFDAMRVYDSAEECLRQVVEFDSITSDNENLVYDLELYGAILRNNNKYDEAEKCFRQGLECSKEAMPAYVSRYKIELASLDNCRNEIDSALSLIRGIPETISESHRPYALAHAAEIYRCAGLADSAYMYAEQLTKYGKDVNLRTAYRVMLYPEVIKYVDQDSVLSYIANYRRLTETYMDQNGDRNALIQNSMYNYQLHEKEKVRLEHSNHLLIMAILIMALLLSMAFLIVFIEKHKGKKRLLELYEMRDDLNNLKKTIQASQKKVQDDKETLIIEKYIPFFDERSEAVTAETINDRKDELRNEIILACMEIAKDKNFNDKLSSDLLLSDEYQELQKYISLHDVINDREFWIKLDKVVHEAYPKFKAHIHVLLGNKCKEELYKTLLLIKCGVSPTGISELLAISQGGVSSRRDRLCQRMFGEKLGNTTFDRVVRSL